jgi:ubiquinone/menaquinone biosynthesis C-methylase UbiE
VVSISGAARGPTRGSSHDLGARMQAVDITPTFVRRAQEAEQGEPLGITYCAGDGMFLPFKSDSFEFATAFMSLMDMPDQAAALQEARRVLRPGGFLQFSTLHPCFVAPTSEGSARRGRAAAGRGGRWLLRPHRRAPGRLVVLDPAP